MIKRGLRSEACRQESSSGKPGYSVYMKLIYSLFSYQELADSKGQGLKKEAAGDDCRPMLDKNRLDAIKLKVKQTVIDGICL